jgi:hypothetical protein
MQGQRRPESKQARCSGGDGGEGGGDVCRPLPELQSFATLMALWRCYDVGDGTRPPLKQLESNADKPKHNWRRGYRRLWNQIKQWVAAVQRRAVMTKGPHLRSAEAVVEEMEAQRLSMGMGVGPHLCEIQEVGAQGGWGERHGGWERSCGERCGGGKRRRRRRRQRAAARQERANRRQQRQATSRH